MRRTLSGTRVNLQEAVALLLHNQAQFVSQMAESDRRFSALERRVEQRFKAIERELYEIKTILYELPEAVRRKIGFEPE